MAEKDRLQAGTKAWVYGCLAAIVFLLGPSFIIDQRGDFFWKIGIGWIIAVLVLSRTASVYAREHRIAQKVIEEDVFSEATKQSTSNTTEATDNTKLSQRFVLFARPFSSEGRISVPTDNLHGLMPKDYTEGPYQTLEELLTRALGDIRVLGGAKDVLGPLRKLTETDWQLEFKALAQSARVIIALPLEGAGTNWELGWLKSAGLLSRTIIVMPMTGVSSEDDLAARWEASRLALSQLDIQIPVYDSKGAYLGFLDDGSLWRYPIKNYSKHALRDLVSRIERGRSRQRPSQSNKIGFACLVTVSIALESYFLEGSNFLLGIVGLFVVPIGLLLWANSVFKTQFSASQGLMSGFVWLVCLILILGGLGEWSSALSGRIGGMTGLPSSVMLLIKFHLIFDAVIASAIISLTFAHQSYKAVIGLRPKEAFRFSLVWTLTALTASSLLWILCSELVGCLAVSLGIASFVGAMTWADALEN